MATNEVDQHAPQTDIMLSEHMPLQQEITRLLSPHIFYSFYRYTDRIPEKVPFNTLAFRLVERSGKTLVLAGPENLVRTAEETAVPESIAKNYKTKDTFFWRIDAPEYQSVTGFIADTVYRFGLREGIVSSGYGASPFMNVRRDGTKIYTYNAPDYTVLFLGVRTYGGNTGWRMFSE